MINYKELTSIRERFKKIASRFVNLCNSDVVVNLYDDHVTIAVNAARIRYAIPKGCSLSEWLSKINAEVYDETCYKFQYDMNADMIYYEMTEADCADTDDIVGDFIAIAKIMLNKVDTELDG